MIKPVIDFTSTWVQSLFIGGEGDWRLFGDHMVSRGISRRQQGIKGGGGLWKIDSQLRAGDHRSVTDPKSATLPPPAINDDRSLRFRRKN